MAMVNEARLAVIEEDAKHPTYWAEAETLTDLCETVRALREALWTMLEIEHWTYVDGNVERAKERCRAIWEKAEGESDGC